LRSRSAWVSDGILDPFDVKRIVRIVSGGELGREEPVRRFHCVRG
jgi:hypothetical protein